MGFKVLIFLADTSLYVNGQWANLLLESVPYSNEFLQGPHIPNEVGMVKPNTAIECHCWITGGISLHKLEHPSAVLYVDVGTSYYWLNRKGIHGRSRSCRGCGMNRLILVSPLCLYQSSVYFLAIMLGLQMALG